MSVRAGMFRFFLRRWEKRTPAWVRHLEVRILWEITARGFGAGGRRRGGFSNAAERSRGSLRGYADFTKYCAARFPTINSKHLYREAYRAGRLLRRLSGFTDLQDLQNLVFFLYRNIGITLRGKLPGEFVVPRCYFSRVYTPAECQIMSNVDAGIIAGICGDGHLVFTERLTEGCAQCRACFYEGKQ